MTLNRNAWNFFLEQIDAQVEGNFLSLAAEFEAIIGHPFQVPQSPQVLFSMLQQAMMTKDKRILTDTVEFIAQLPPQLQADFRLYSRKHPDAEVGEHHHPRHHRDSLGSPREKHLAKKFWDMLHRDRIA